MYRHYVNLLILVSAILYGQPAAAQAQTGVQDVYEPGYVSIYTPLSLFVAPNLQPACQDLLSGNLTAAEQSFEAASNKYPGDEGSYVGLLQATGHFDRIELAKLERTAIATRSHQDQFRLGVYSLYMLCLYVPSDGSHDRDINHLISDAKWGLKSDFSGTRSLLAGFLLANAGIYDLSFVRNDEAIYESMLQELCGREIFGQYEQAKANEWAGPLPAIPKLSPQRLEILHRVVRELYSQNSTRIGSITHGGTAPPLPPFTAEQQAAMTYLSAWADSIEKQVTS